MVQLVLKSGGSASSPNRQLSTGGSLVAEIDSVIQDCPGVKLTQTVGVPHETLGELVVACVVPHAGAALDEATIRNFLTDKLASYKVPRRVLFFRESDLQLTGSAKVKTAELRDLATRTLEGLRWAESSATSH
jgi:fatty-acyl-CoA synthase